MNVNPSIYLSQKTILLQFCNKPADSHSVDTYDCRNILMRPIHREIAPFSVLHSAGIGAGLGTGFAGLSAASVVGPLLSTFLDVSPYQAIGVGLISDVLASSISAYT